MTYDKFKELIKMVFALESLKPSEDIMMAWWDTIPDEIKEKGVSEGCEACEDGRVYMKVRGVTTIYPCPSCFNINNYIESNTKDVLH